MADGEREESEEQYEWNAAINAASYVHRAK